MFDVQHVDPNRGPKGAPAHIDPKSGAVLDAAGDRIGTSEPSDILTHKLSGYIANVTSGRRLLDLRPSDVNSGVAYGFFAPDLDPCADEASAIVPVTQQIGARFYEDPLSATKLSLPNAAEPGAQVATTNIAPLKVSYDCVQYGLAADVPAGLIAQADFDLLKATAYRLAIGLRLAREVRVANLLTTVGTWASANQRVLGATTKWNGGSSADPIADLFAVMGASTLPITDIIMSEAVVPLFVTSNAATVTRVQNFLMAWGELEDMQNTHQFPRITVANMKTVAGSGATPVPSYVWGSSTAANVVLLRRPANEEALSSCRTFRYVGDTPDGVSKNGYLVRTFWLDHNTARGGEGIVVVSNDSEKVLSNTVGGIITGAIQ